MGCLFRCFRPKGCNARGMNRTVASSIPSARRNSLASKKQLGSFFLDEHHQSPKQVAIPTTKDKKGQTTLYRELKREVLWSHTIVSNVTLWSIVKPSYVLQAELLKTCGTLLQTPAIIHKTPSIQASIRDGVSSNDVSKTPDTCKKILWDGSHELSRRPVKEQDNSDLSRSNFERSTIEGQQKTQHDECSSPPVNSSNPVGFKVGQTAEEKLGNRTSEAFPSQHESNYRSFTPECAPPTPLNTKDEMETAAVVYPANVKNYRDEMTLLGMDSSEHLQSYNSFEQRTEHYPCSRESVQQMSPKSDPEGSELSSNTSLTSPIASLTSPSYRRSKDEVIYTENIIPRKTANSLETPSSKNKTPNVPECPEQIVPSLSQWMKPLSSVDREKNEIREKSNSARSLDADRPILGMVAAHWKDEEPERKFQRQWDGNGIPNSTNKYKEDQKVSWHATPFEERLEKALSDETFLLKSTCHRSEPLEFEDGELTDTAAS